MERGPVLGYGLPFPTPAERIATLEETVVLLRRLWTEETVTFAGDHVSAVDAYCSPKPAPVPAVLIGGGGEKLLLRVAARPADIWNNSSVAQGELAHKVSVLRDHCADVGRDPAEITVSQQCIVVLAADEAAAREAMAKATRIYGPEAGGVLEEHGIWGSPARVIDAVHRHVELGCTHFVVELFGRDTREPARLFADTVLPAFR